MKITDYIDLRQRCLDLVEEAVSQTADEEYIKIFIEVSTMIYLLDSAETVINTFKGIIGYHIWLQKNKPESVSFRVDAMHDLIDCVKYHEEEWYSPRTSRYNSFYSKK